MISVFDVADYIISKKSITKYKLHRLCYLVYETSLSINGEPLFEEEFIAGESGPLSIRLESELPSFFTDNISLGNKNLIEENAKKIVDMVLDEFLNMQPYELDCLLKEEESWKTAHKKVMSKELIINSYKARNNIIIGE